MPEILGLPLGTFVSRLGGAIVTAVLTLIVFLYLPQMILSRFPTSSSFDALTGSGFGYLIYYAVFITILSGISTVYRDHWLGDIASLANSLTQIFYIYIITNGGLLSVAVGGGTSLSIDFSSLLYLLMAPSALGAISSVVRMVSRSAATRVREQEEIILR